MRTDSGHLSNLATESSKRNTTDSAEVYMADEEARLERARESRRRYRRKEKEKDELTHQRIKETQLELEQLRLEQAMLINQTKALTISASYSNNMIEALSAAASASAAKARSLGDQAMEGVNTFCGWAKHQWLMLPTIPELLAGSMYNPSDEQLRWLIKISNPNEFHQRHERFLDRLTLFLEEGKKSPEAQKHAELRINYFVSNWRRLLILFQKEKPELWETVACGYQLKSIREHAAAENYVRPGMLESGSDELSRSVALSYEQRSQLEKHWEEFVKDIKAARAILGTHTSKVADRVEATMETGQYNPGSSKSNAESFLLMTEAAGASDEFLLRQGQAFLKLHMGAIQLLNPLQVAIVLTSCRPLVAHFPEMCNMLLQGPIATITDANNSQ